VCVWKITHSFRFSTDPSVWNLTSVCIAILLLLLSFFPSYSLENSLVNNYIFKSFLAFFFINAAVGALPFNRTWYPPFKIKSRPLTITLLGKTRKYWFSQKTQKNHKNSPSLTFLSTLDCFEQSEKESIFLFIENLREFKPNIKIFCFGVRTNVPWYGWLRLCHQAKKMNGWTGLV